MFILACRSPPVAPANVKVVCSKYSAQCYASCLEQNYLFPNGQAHIQTLCENGKWRAHGTDWTAIPACERMTFYFLIQLVQKCIGCFTINYSQFKLNYIVF